ncbi:hypothetical protein SAMN04488030_2608 [Aliiroseovarius halocynthiae]|uniref:Uncharacterized protein n=1 Tax=Aliiroseovarius halocynthiae TaxID=985055 RepID=A0A545SPY0_9RHOB|nr:hypothetical protein [Aliiroseovarius halocynthiae]TQV67021.1 hypothetical protein FIL88_10550 [Aliiroseovarius halocynthiae]SMR82261.1 hypothetical protein SAMN04488030_2608 [Aliiroseovarius halocynthiae]
MKREVEGWDGVPLRKHVENAQQTATDAQQVASDARDLAEVCCDEQATLSARLGEIERRLAAFEGGSEA